MSDNSNFGPSDRNLPIQVNDPAIARSLTTDNAVGSLVKACAFSCSKTQTVGDGRAVASDLLLTKIADVAGVFSVLSLATLMMAWLV